MLFWGIIIPQACKSHMGIKAAIPRWPKTARARNVARSLKDVVKAPSGTI